MFDVFVYFDNDAKLRVPRMTRSNMTETES